MSQYVDYRSYRSGYPQYAALLADCGDYRIFRTFQRTRMRMLLRKQDIISELEEELDQLDKDEQASIFLGSRRYDKNPRRLEVFSLLDKAFEEYDNLLQRSQWATNMPVPSTKHLKSLHGWHHKNGSIPKREIEYLKAEKWDQAAMDLNQEKINIQSIYRFAEEVTLFGLAIKKQIFKSNNEGRGSLVYFRPLVMTISRAIIATSTVVILFIPIIVLNTVHKKAWRFAIIFLATSVFVLLLATISVGKLTDIFAAGAAYTAVLVVFVSGNGV